MSTFISAVQALLLQVSLMTALQAVLGALLALSLVLLFKPLLLGLVRALALVIRPKHSREERAQRRKMRDALVLNRMLNSMDVAPSHAAELRALAARA
ncbi:MAG: hypothetical protein K2X55_19095 [Burkholderiaceae bacterium]|nr:hypothetical protein [Burkholderiaceae bacterium]